MKIKFNFLTNSIIIVVLLIILTSIVYYYTHKTHHSKKDKKVSIDLGSTTNTNQYIIDFPFKFTFPNIHDSSISIRAVGDILLHKRLQTFALSHKDQYNYFFKSILKELQEADITFGNMESPISKSHPISGWPRFNIHTNLIPALKTSGFDIVSTANNHALDKGKKGVIETIKALSNANIIPVGTYFRGESPLKIISKKGINIGFLAFSEYTNGLPVPKTEVSISLLDMRNKKHVKNAIKLIRASKKKVDFLIISYHFGNEYILNPEPWKEKIVYQILNAGGDALLGHHPHVLQHAEKYKTMDGRETFIIYSLGNFISGMSVLPKYGNILSNYAHRGDGLILDINLVKSKDRTYIRKVGFIPTWTLMSLGHEINPKNSNKIKMDELGKYTETLSFKVINLSKEIYALNDNEKFNELKKFFTKRKEVIINQMIKKLPDEKTNEVK